MKNSKKLFILTEIVLGVMVVILAFILIREKNGRDLKKISVIVQHSDDSQWSAFKYGLKMAAQDKGVDVFIVNTGKILTVEEELDIIRDEIENGADAVILQPAPGIDAEKSLKKIRNRVPVILVECAAREDGESSGIPAVKPDNYAMGRTLAEELLKDYSGSLEEKTLGIVMENSNSEADVSRRRGVEDALRGTGADVLWFVSDSFGENEENSLDKQSKVDIVIALDDSSLTAAGEYSLHNNLHGALVYGIGNSTEAIYYLDTEIVQCLIVPDGFNMGYQSVTAAAEGLGYPFFEVKSETVSYFVIHREELFSPQNQEIIFTMSQ